MEEKMKNSSYDKLTPQKRQIIDEVMGNLENDNGIWRPGWGMPGVPVSGVSNKPYRGVNNFTLTLTAMARQYSDPRWLTFNQMKEKGWKFKTDEEGKSLGRGAGVSVEFFELRDKETGKCFDSKTLDGMTVEEKEEYLRDNVRPIRKYYTVFNGDVIDGIPEREKRSVNPNDKVDRVENLLDYWSSNEAKIVYGGQDAYYRISADEIHLPEREKFFSMQEFYSTALHELGHSTGHVTRLNRDIQNTFGTTDYAIEELRAEIASMFMEQDLEIVVDEKHKRNNSAYISAWKERIKDDPNALFTAIADADRIAKYVSEKEKQIKAEKKKMVEHYAIRQEENYYGEPVYKVYMEAPHGQVALGLAYAFVSREALMEEFEKMQELPYWADKEFEECSYEELETHSLERAKSEQIEEEKSEVFMRPSEVAAKAMPTATRQVDMSDRGIDTLVKMSDRDVVEKASKTKSGEKFNQLYNGISVLGDEEKDERSLMSRLAMFCNGDKEQLLRVFKSSGQFRDEKPNSFYERLAEQSIKFVERIKGEQTKPFAPMWGKGKQGLNAKT